MNYIDVDNTDEVQCQWCGDWIEVIKDPNPHFPEPERQDLILCSSCEEEDAEDLL